MISYVCMCLPDDSVIERVYMESQKYIQAK